MNEAVLDPKTRKKAEILAAEEGLALSEFLDLHNLPSILELHRQRHTIHKSGEGFVPYPCDRPNCPLKDKRMRNI